MAKKQRRYKLVNSLRNSAVSELFLARRPDADGEDELVWIERLHTALAADPAVVERFGVGARVEAEDAHAHVVRVHKVARSTRGHVLVMERVDGPTLHAVSAAFQSHGRRLPLGMVVSIAEQLCEGLAFIHGARRRDNGELLELIHRDVRPRSILISTEGVVKLMDFGLPRTPLAVTRTRASMHEALRYLPPEEHREEALTPASDQFVAALIITELLTGAPVYADGALPRLITRVNSADVHPALAAVAEVSPGVAHVLRKALALSPADRYAGTRILGRALRAATLGAPPGPSLAALAVAMIGGSARAFVEEHGALPGGELPRSRRRVAPRRPAAPAPRLSAGPPPPPSLSPLDPAAQPLLVPHLRQIAVDPGAGRAGSPFLPSQSGDGEMLIPLPLPGLPREEDADPPWGTFYDDEDDEDTEIV